MRYILIILVFLSVGAKAQMVIKAHANYRPLVQPAANLLLDDYPNAAAAYSLRKLDKDYTGSCIRIRRDSTGQTETDIGFDASGVVDTNAIKSFLRNNSGRVVRWYDQSGNGRDKINTTAATQPEIAFLGVIKRTNGKPCVNFQAANVLTSASTYTITHSIQVARVLTQTVVNYIYTNANIGFFWNGTAGGVNGIGAFDGTNARSLTGEDLNQHLAWYSMRGGNIHIARDGGTETNTGAFAASITVDRIGGRQNAAGIDFQGEVQEVIAWNSDQSSNRTGIENNINDYYNIYWNGDFTGILDTYPNSAAAYSLRNLSSTYKGPLIRVRKDTTGQPEMDIYGDYYGNLDTVGLKNFLQTRSGFITTWYDQSGNGRNASQSTQANQPRIALNGVIDRRSGDLAAVFDGSNDYLQNSTNNVFRINNISHYAVSSRGNSANSVRVIYATGILAGTDGFGFFYTIDDPGVSSQNNLMQHFRNPGAIVGIGNYVNTLNTNNLIFGYSTSSNNFTYFNGGDEKSASHTLTNNTHSGKMTIGARNNGLDSYGFFLNGTVTEIVFWEANQSSNRSGIQTNVNNYWSIY